ncbi:MAG: hypothetical protein WCP32_00140 [Bacteroidota bacterium]
MQSKKLKKLITIFFVLFIFSACTKDLIVPDPPSPPPPPPVPGKISYAGEIQPIFNEKCVSCHGIGQNPPVLIDGKSYLALKNMAGMIDIAVPENSDLYIEMAPGGGMSQHCNKANADSVLKWINEGAVNN